MPELEFVNPTILSIEFIGNPDLTVAIPIGAEGPQGDPGRVDLTEDSLGVLDPDTIQTTIDGWFDEFGLSEDDKTSAVALLSSIVTSQPSNPQAALVNVSNLLGLLLATQTVANNGIDALKSKALPTYTVPMIGRWNVNVDQVLSVLGTFDTITPDFPTPSVRVHIATLPLDADPVTIADIPAPHLFRDLAATEEPEAYVGLNLSPSAVASADGMGAKLFVRVSYTFPGSIAEIVICYPNGFPEDSTVDADVLIFSDGNTYSFTVPGTPAEVIGEQVTATIELTPVLASDGVRVPPDTLGVADPGLIEATITPLAQAFGMDPTGAADYAAAFAAQVHSLPEIGVFYGNPMIELDAIRNLASLVAVLFVSDAVGTQQISLALASKLDAAEKAQPDGVATLGNDGKVPTEQLPAAINGQDGADGASAYEVAVSNGFIGDEAAWLLSLNGTDGIDGKTILYGTAAPTTEGVNGDFYIRTTTNYIYGPKAAGTWPVGTSLVGPAGDPTTVADGAIPQAKVNGLVDKLRNVYFNTPVSGDVLSMQSSTLGGTTALPINAMQGHGMFLGTGLIDRIGVYHTANAASTWRVLLYPVSASTGRPVGESLLLDAGVIDLSTGAGAFNWKTISYTIPYDGLFYGFVQGVTYSASPGTHLVQYGGVSMPMIPGLPTNTSSVGRNFVGFQVNTPSTSAPTTCPGTLLSWIGQVPRIYVRYA